MRSFARFMGSAAGLMVLLSAGAWAFLDVVGRQAVPLSIGAALVVQGAAFGSALSLRSKQMLVMWGVGSLVRFVALVLYGVLIAILWRAALTPALLSFAVFLFVTTLVEPLFLRR